MQMRRSEAPPLAPSLSLRGAAGPTASPIAPSARGACRPVVRPAARVTSKRSGASNRDSLDPSKLRGWGTGPRVPTLTFLGLSFHICAMGVTIPALLAARSGCESVGVAEACGKP